MSLKEAKRLSVMQQVDKNILTLRQASEELALSLRQMKRVRKRYRLEGILGLISRHVGKIGPNRIDREIKTEVLKILHSEDYNGFGPTFARDKIEERQGYCLSSETIRKWMIEQELWVAKRKRKCKIHQRRARRARFGELLQGDGSRHAWFEDRGPECTIVLFVDDATSKITTGKFVPAETTESYQQILKEHLYRYGRPKALYVDKHSIFRTSRENSVAQERETHFGRVLRELRIELICAHSPQAKGRVERANGTLQDRLIKEMRLQKICTIEEANRYLPVFIDNYNKKYGVEPREKQDAHRRFNKKVDLDRLFAKQATRKIAKDLSFSYQGVTYQIHVDTPNRFTKMYVNILDRPGKPLLIECAGKGYTYTRWNDQVSQKPKVFDSKELEAYWPSRPVKPKRNHPWR